MIVPYTERVLVSFETDKEIPELERGFRMVEVDNWDAAIDIFQKVVETYSSSPLILRPITILSELHVHRSVRQGKNCIGRGLCWKVRAQISERHQ